MWSKAPPSAPSLVISEVAPWSSGNSPVGADWFEVTNTGASAVNITGWKMDDNSNAFANAVALNGITSIAPGESVIFIETGDLAGAAAAFRTTWFGANPPAGLQIGSYSGGGVGLSTGGDAVNLYDGGGALQASVTFGASPASAPFATFDNAAGLNNAAISLLSAVGVHGAFVGGERRDRDRLAWNGRAGRQADHLRGGAVVQRQQPVAADWFEVTNIGGAAVDITGWKMDDSSESFAAAVPLNGITSIAARRVGDLHRNRQPRRCRGGLPEHLVRREPAGGPSDRQLLRRRRRPEHGRRCRRPLQRQRRVAGQGVLRCFSRQARRSRPSTTRPA